MISDFPIHHGSIGIYLFPIIGGLGAFVSTIFWSRKSEKGSNSQMN